MSLRWLRMLWTGRFPFGTTFFAGMFGPPFIFVPAGVVIAGFLAVVAPDMMMPAIVVMTVIYALYVTATLPAVVKTGLAAKDVGGWRWFGIFLGAAAVIALWVSAYKFAMMM
jgi:hypothetical protein